MDVKELMDNRHSVREYLDKPIEEEKRKILDDFTYGLNISFGTNVKIIYDDETLFKNGKASYGNFCGCKNIVVLIGKDAEFCGFVGALIALKAQELELNTCFVALTYKKSAVKSVVETEEGEKIQCCIALGYGKNQGHERKSKKYDDVVEINGEKPEKFDEVVDACLKAPTALNQQKFKVYCEKGKIYVRKSGFGFYTDVDLGIVKAYKDLILGKITL